MQTSVASPVRLVLVTAPATEPVTVAELKSSLRIDGTDDDAMLAALLATARSVLEGITGRSFVETEWRAHFDEWPRVGSFVGAAQSREIKLPKAPLIEVGSVKYIDADGAEQTIDSNDYTVEPGISANWFGRIWINQGVEIPSLGQFPGALRVTFTAGYGAAAVVPEEIKTAIKLLAGHIHTNPVPVNVGNIVNEVPYSLRFLIENLTVPSLP